MPSGRTHDVITMLLMVPAAAGTYFITKDIMSSSLVAATFVFGGVMFGPDLDTKSKQYSRWSFFRSIWLPYRKFFSHRSRFTHGLIFGALFRVIYFIGFVTLVAYLIALAWNGISDDAVPDLRDFVEAWRSIADTVRGYFGANFFVLSFVGMWLGAASHTLSDVAITYVKTGKIDRML
jgi:uncharacterized metal-binding protein